MSVDKYWKKCIALTYLWYVIFLFKDTIVFIGGEYGIILLIIDITQNLQWNTDQNVLSSQMCTKSYFYIFWS